MANTMSKDKQIKNAQLDWGETDNDQFSPRSIFFDDIYFSGDGPEETEHVFLHGNGLPDRWRNYTRIAIGELGFGTGLNFLAAWDQWRNTEKPNDARLDFFSIEAFPLTPSDLSRAHQAWPTLAALSERLLKALPPPQPGFHQIELDHHVTLTLFYGDVLDGLENAEAKIDAWFLDGFSPAKNPAMWRDDVMAALGRLSNDGATLATFTVAGAVRRALSAAGFDVEKRPGHGRKREMLTGKLASQPKTPPKRKPWHMSDTSLRLAPGARIAVIGGGIAGASLAYALTREGFAPIVYESDAPASGASGNPAGLIMPRLDVGDMPDGRFHVDAYVYTVQLLNRLQSQTKKTLFNPCGVVWHATKDEEKIRHQKLVARQPLPKDWFTEDHGGLVFPQAGVVQPCVFVASLLGETPIRLTTVTRLNQKGKQWQVDCADGKTDTIDAVVIANGLGALKFQQARSLPLSGAAGQVDWFPEGEVPDQAHVFGPYVAPAPDGGVLIGATYAPIAIGAEPAFTAEATQSNIAAIKALMPELAQTLDPEKSRPRASIRCFTPDRMPIAGPVPDWGFYSGAYDGIRHGRLEDYPAGKMQPGLFILASLGSRGLVTAPLAAAMIAREMAGAPAPVESAVAEALHPARFFIRDLKRAKNTRH